jgi:hypothetical protein
MKIAAATTFSLNGYNEYAYRLIESFNQYWDKNIDLYVYYDQLPSQGWNIQSPNIHYIPANFPNLLAFKERNRAHPKASTTNFIFDGVRFSHKVYAYIDMATNKNVDIAIWLDGDTITHQPVNNDVVMRWLNGKMAGALFRPTIFTETGFHIFDMRYPEAKVFMQQWIDWYNTDQVWNLSAYTDCHTYDATVAQFDINLWNNLSPTIRHPHPFINGILGEHMDHTKGPRKIAGRSYTNDIVVPRTEKYWNKK